MEDKKTIIQTDKLCKSFKVGGTRHDIIKDMDLSIYDGDFTVIMGSSGAGKSTGKSGKDYIFRKEYNKVYQRSACHIQKKTLRFRISADTSDRNDEYPGQCTGCRTFDGTE